VLRLQEENSAKIMLKLNTFESTNVDLIKVNKQTLEIHKNTNQLYENMNINLSNLNVEVSENSDKLDKQVSHNNIHMG